MPENTALDAYRNNSANIVLPIQSGESSILFSLVTGEKVSGDDLHPYYLEPDTFAEIKRGSEEYEDSCHIIFVKCGDSDA